MLVWLKKFQRVRPSVIEGYVEAIIKVAQFAQDQNIRMDQLGIKAVITTTGVLFPGRAT